MCKCREFRVICLDVGADGAEFASFAVFSWSLLIHSRLLAMGVDWANFTWFAGTVGEMREIWAIRSNFVEFSADGQESESIELMWMNFVANFA